MSAREIVRRQKTGTLNVGVVKAPLAKGTESFKKLYKETEVAKATSDASSGRTIFSVSLSSECFSAPAQLEIPLSYRVEENLQVPLPVKFTPDGVGHYPCNVVLEAAGDIRLYKIECTVIPKGLCSSTFYVINDILDPGKHQHPAYCIQLKCNLVRDVPCNLNYGICWSYTDLCLRGMCCSR